MALAYLKSANRSGPKLYVRVNALDTGLTLGDLAAVMQGKPDGIVFPKCVGQANLDLLATYLDALEAREGIEAGATRILTIATESAAAVLALTAAPAKHARLIGPFVGWRGSNGRPRRTGEGPLARRLRRHLQAGAHRQPDGVGGRRHHRLRHGLSRHQECRRPARRGARRPAHGLWRQDRHPSRPGRDHPRGVHADGAAKSSGPSVSLPPSRAIRGRRAHPRRQDAGQAAPRAGPPPGRAGRVDEGQFRPSAARSTGCSAATGSRSSRSTNSWADCTDVPMPSPIVALNVPNVIPTGIPWLSTITGVPMLLPAGAVFRRPRRCRWLPLIDRQTWPAARQAAGFPRSRPRRFIQWLENTVHAAARMVGQRPAASPAAAGVDDECPDPRAAHSASTISSPPGPSSSSAFAPDRG